MSSKLAERLRDLRISTEALSSKTSLSRQRAAEILSGSKASVAEVRDICSGLRLPIQIFSDTSSQKPERDLAPLFRSIRNSSDDYNITVERISIFIQSSLNILPPRESLPNWFKLFPTVNKNFATADRLSKVARILLDSENPDGPLSDFGLLLGSLEGVILSKLDHSRYEGISLIAGNYCFIFVSPRFAGRMLFTLGHEFGHLIADHKHGPFARFEKAKQIGSFGGSSRTETFVDAFASCLLIPDTGLGKALAFFQKEIGLSKEHLTDRDILLVARFFGVSFDVAGRRMEGLGLLPQGLTTSLASYLRREYGSPEKRADLLGINARTKVELPDIPSNLSPALLSALRQGDISVGWASNNLGYSIGQIFSEQAKAL